MENTNNLPATQDAITTLDQISQMPPLVYKDVPVLTSELLAKAYGVKQHQIRQNFNNNQERFVEGKHYFLLKDKDLEDFKQLIKEAYPVSNLRVDNIDSQNAKQNFESR